MDGWINGRVDACMAECMHMRSALTRHLFFLEFKLGKNTFKIKYTRTHRKRPCTGIKNYAFNSKIIRNTLLRTVQLNHAVHNYHDQILGTHSRNANIFGNKSITMMFAYKPCWLCFIDNINSRNNQSLCVKMHIIAIKGLSH